ncbi:Eco57I restriction-modification methylase domain-containing protein [Aerococcus sp. YH-aer221]|uniref:Eco57I restriction-modification methylase domain-containing protein n=1 Tax=Aerococcus kribbianus TaxID=2999064 RepID=UPI002285B6BC|nr:Eco57I restriction-modification methylase domain-containing protein [Aerococcus sp. YH-aer221]MCZ0716817.1 Eco57I restriction-modification methylase domain-containing protein [Aerococcus sp. YH-aer221]
MKFDVIIGNPPYQEEAKGKNKFTAPLYHKFMEQSYIISNKVLLITPARFLFNAGSTPKLFNQKMLNDTHFKIIYYEPKSNNIFPNTDIKGGIVVSYKDAKKNFGPINTFTPFSELNSILQKVKKIHEISISNYIYPQDKYNLNELYNDYPELKSIIGSNGKDRRLRTNAFERLNVFTKTNLCDDDYKIIGLIKNKRTYRYIKNKYIAKSPNLNKFKVFVPKSNGSGALGEVLSTPMIGHTQSFISIGILDNENEANNLLKYIKTKFTRVLLGTLKVTQDNPKSTWENIPIQNFTNKSDIDWTQSIANIDQQLYKKYNLSDTEISFIENNVQEMN